MQAIILAAGIGKRLGSITQNIPKPMIKVDNKPILEHNILMCKRNGIEDIFINLHHLPSFIKNYFGDGKKWGVNIKYKYEPKLLGTAQTVYNFQDHLSESFFVVYGDNYFNYDTDLNYIKSFHDSKNSDFTIGLCKVDDVSNSGVAEQNSSGKITSFIEKPSASKVMAGWVNAGIYYSSFDMLNNFDKKLTDFGSHLIPHLINSSYNVYGVKLKNKVIAIDTPHLFNKEINNDEKFQS